MLTKEEFRACACIPGILFVSAAILCFSIGIGPWGWMLLGGGITLWGVPTSV